ncbi:unnamed protein product, partial [Musa textilis]
KEALLTEWGRSSSIQSISRTNQYLSCPRIVIPFRKPNIDRRFNGEQLPDGLDVPSYSVMNE